MKYIALDQKFTGRIETLGENSIAWITSITKNWKTYALKLSLKEKELKNWNQSCDIPELKKAQQTLRGILCELGKVGSVEDSVPKGNNRDARIKLPECRNFGKYYQELIRESIEFSIIRLSYDFKIKIRAE